MLPKEHGSWAVLLGPIVVGLASAPAIDPAAGALFALAALGAFLTRRPLYSLLSPSPEVGTLRWLAAYATVATAAGGWLVLALERLWLPLFALPAVAALVLDRAFRAKGRPLHPLNEAAGILALCAGAPAASYAASGTLHASAATAWALCALYFLGPIFHVKLAALGHRAASDPTLDAPLDRARALSLAYHAVAVGVVAGMALARTTSPWAMLPFLAALLKAAAQTRRAPSRVDFRALGYREVAFAAFFTLVLCAAARAS